MKNNQSDGTWSQCYSGAIVKFRDIPSSDFRIEDVAHALSLTCRYNGMVPKFYSVAEHSYLASKAAYEDGKPLALVLLVLLHDASEAYLNDIIRPAKGELHGYYELESAIQEEVETQLHSKAVIPINHCYLYKEQIRYYDELMLFAEKKKFFPVESFKWKIVHSFPDYFLNDWAHQIKPLSPKKAEKKFLNYFNRLVREIRELHRGEAISLLNDVQDDYSLIVR